MFAISSLLSGAKGTPKKGVASEQDIDDDEVEDKVKENIFANFQEIQKASANDLVAEFKQRMQKRKVRNTKKHKAVQYISEFKIAH